MYNGFEFQGNLLEVREDRFPNGHMGGGFAPRGGFAGRGGFGGGFGGRGGFAGGYAGGFGGGFPGAGGFGAGGFGAAGGFPSGPGFTPEPRVIQPSTQIFVKNVSFSPRLLSSFFPLFFALSSLTRIRFLRLQLPWSTSNEDLVELFQTTGTVEQAEVLFEHGRSKGAGVVQFASVEEAETAIAKFHGYSYGGKIYTLALSVISRRRSSLFVALCRSSPRYRIQRSLQGLQRCFWWWSYSCWRRCHGCRVSSRRTHELLQS